jgi:hypothetical protein
MEADGRVAGVRQLLRDGCAGVKRAVAIGAEMAEVKVFHARCDDFGGHLRRRVVGKMAMPG